MSTLVGHTCIWQTALANVGCDIFNFLREVEVRLIVSNYLIDVAVRDDSSEDAGTATAQHVMD